MGQVKTADRVKPRQFACSTIGVRALPFHGVAGAKHLAGTKHFAGDGRNDDRAN
jgi:hypothetical protein